MINSNEWLCGSNANHMLYTLENEREHNVGRTVRTGLSAADASELLEDVTAQQGCMTFFLEGLLSSLWIEETAYPWLR